MESIHQHNIIISINMTIQNDFCFSITHSRIGYPNKEEAKMALSGKKIYEHNKKAKDPSEKKCKMAFLRDIITINRFAEMATSGYSFCNLFAYDSNKMYWIKHRNKSYLNYPEYKKGPNKGAMKIIMKCGDYYEGCQCFFVDIDYTNFEDVQDFINALPLKPTVTYMSYSDNLYKTDKKQKHNPKYDETKGIKSRRFRLCYVFNEIVYGKDNYVKISSAINKMVEDATNEPIQDDCGTRCVQYFNGSMSKEVYISYCVYSIDDFAPYMEKTKEAGDYQEKRQHPNADKNTTDVPAPFTAEMKENANALQDEMRKRAEAILNPPFATEINTKLLISDMYRLGYDDFMKKYRHLFKYHYRKDDGKWDEDCMIIGDDYFALHFPTKPLKDGEKRRKKLYERMCLRRVMFPTITFNEVLFDAYEDLHRFIDNTQDPIDNDCLIRNVESAFKRSVEELNVVYSDSIARLKSKAPKKGIIYNLHGTKTPAERNRKKKEIRWKMLDDNYNPDDSLRENAKRLGFSEKTLRRYCQDKDIDPHTKTTDEELLQLIVPAMSIRDNVANLKDSYGINVSKDRVGKLKKELFCAQ